MQNRIANQLQKCYEKYGRYSSAHEAYGVLQEEVDELWDIVKQKPSERDLQALQSEIIDCIVVLFKMNEDIVEKRNVR